MRTRAGIAVLLLLGVVLGSLREFLFINLNYEIDRVRYHRPIAYAHSRFRAWTEGWDLGALLTFKWVLSFAYMAAMLGLAILLMRLLQGHFRAARHLALAYAALGLLALGFHALSGSVPPLEAVGVKLLHLLQYPVLLFFLWAAHLLRAGTKRA